MSGYSGKLDEFRAFNESSNLVAASSEGGRLLQVALAVAQWAVDNATDSTGITAASKEAAVANILAALSVTTKQDLKLVDGGSLVSKIMGELTESDRVKVAQQLS